LIATKAMAVAVLVAAFAVVAACGWIAFRGQDATEKALESSEAAAQDLTTIVHVTGLVAFTEGIAATAIFAFCATMTEEMRGSSQNVGFYSGLLYTAYYTGKLLMQYPLMVLSDHVGRRPVLLLGMFSSIVFNLSMAFISEYWLMVAVRFLYGCFNANNAVSRTSLREAFNHRDADDKQAFSCVSSWYAVSSLLGPSLGGVLYGKELAIDWTWLSWTLPWVLIALLYLVCFLGVLSLHSETAFLPEREKPGSPRPQGTTNLSTDRGFLLVMVMAWGHSYVFAGWETIYSTLAELDASELGEDWSTTQVGVNFLVGGIALVTYNQLVYTWLASAVTVRRLWVWSWALPIVVLMVFPRLVTYLMSQGANADGVGVAVVNYGSQIVISVLLGSGFTSINLIVNDYVATLPDHRKQLASANGALAALQALAMAVSPTVTGALYSLSFSTSFLSRSTTYDHLAVVGIVTGVLCALV